jgi:6-phosphogluconolactonase
MGKFAFWTDLGTDRILIDRFDGAAGTLEPNSPDSVGIQPGSGPRHFAWHPSRRAIYLLNELSSTVSVLRFDADRGALEIFQTASARAAGAAGQTIAAEIAVSPDGRFLYASNRGDDDIAVFAIDDSTLGLTPAGHVRTCGRGPRSFAIDPSGRWLVAANEGSDSLVTLGLDPGSGGLSAGGPLVSIPSPVCVLFAPSSEASESGCPRVR